MSLISLYKRSSTFVHLAYLDHCPNVVVDAQAAGCNIVCSSSGGTKEVVDKGFVVVEEEWDYKPIPLYKPPTMDFTQTVKIKSNKESSFEKCVRDYYNILKDVI